MAELTGPWLSLGVGVPLAAALAARLPATRPRARVIAVTASAASLLLSLATVRELAGAGWAALSEPWIPAVFQATALNAVTMALFAALALVTLISAPRRDSDPHSVAHILILMAGTLAAYGAVSLPVFLGGWILGLTPSLASAGREGNRLAVVESAASTLFLAVGMLLQTSSPAGACMLLVLAAILRTGLFPFHGVAASRLDKGPLGFAGLLLSAQLGVFLLIRFALPMFPESARDARSWLCWLALFTAIYTAVMGMVERSPRRLLALVLVSQSAAIFAGLVTARPEGVMGALAQWIVLGFTSTVMISIFRAVEARLDFPLDGERLLGLAGPMPRLAVFFAVSAFALVGLPGTLGFPGEDLLIHGVLSAHPVIGFLLPTAIAINAYHLYRLFSRLFLGAPAAAWAAVPDALPRERWPLAACLVVLVWFGLMPGQLVALRAFAVEAVVTVAGR